MFYSVFRPMVVVTKSVLCTHPLPRLPHSPFPALVPCPVLCSLGSCFQSEIKTKPLSKTSSEPDARRNCVTSKKESNELRDLSGGGTALAALPRQEPIGRRSGW